MSLENKRIAIVGLGYVGLPLAIEFAEHFPVIGFDINKNRIFELNKGLDQTKEADLPRLNERLEFAKSNNHDIGLVCTDDINILKTANVFIVTVPNTD